MIDYDLKEFPGFPRRLAGSPWVRQALKFMLVGVLNTGLDWGLYLLLSPATGVISLTPVLAKLLSYTAGTVNSFFLNRHWTFQSQATFLAAFGPYFLISLMAIGLNTGSMFLGLHFLQLGEIPALLLATLVAFGWNFLISKLVIFRW